MSLPADPRPRVGLRGVVLGTILLAATAALVGVALIEPPTGSAPPTADLSVEIADDSVFVFNNGPDSARGVVLAFSRQDTRCGPALGFTDSIGDLDPGEGRARDAGAPCRRSPQPPTHGTVHDTVRLTGRVTATTLDPHGANNEHVFEIRTTREEIQPRDERPGAEPAPSCRTPDDCRPTPGPPPITSPDSAPRATTVVCSDPDDRDGDGVLCDDRCSDTAPWERLFALDDGCTEAGGLLHDTLPEIVPAGEPQAVAVWLSPRVPASGAAVSSEAGDAPATPTISMRALAEVAGPQAVGRVLPEVARWVAVTLEADTTVWSITPSEVGPKRVLLRRTAVTWSWTVNAAPCGMLKPRCQRLPPQLFVTGWDAHPDSGGVLALDHERLETFNHRPIVVEATLAQAFAAPAALFAGLLAAIGVGWFLFGGLDPSKVRILFIASRPRETEDLDLAGESRAIRFALEGSSFGAQYFDLEQLHAAEFPDLAKLIQTYRPHVIHFSGHGNPGSEVMLRAEGGGTRVVSPQALGRLFGSSAENRVRCVVLNACYSATQADALLPHTDCVIGMSRAVGDEAAIEFATGFYEALGNGESLEDAFSYGSTRVEGVAVGRLRGLGIATEPTSEADTPQLRVRAADMRKFVLADLAPGAKKQRKRRRRTS